MNRNLGNHKDYCYQNLYRYLNTPSSIRLRTPYTTRDTFCTELEHLQQPGPFTDYVYVRRIPTRLEDRSKKKQEEAKTNFTPGIKHWEVHILRRCRNRREHIHTRTRSTVGKVMIINYSGLIEEKVGDLRGRGGRVKNARPGCICLYLSARGGLHRHTAGNPSRRVKIITVIRCIPSRCHGV